MVGPVLYFREVKTENNTWVPADLSKERFQELLDFVEGKVEQRNAPSKEKLGLKSLLNSRNNFCATLIFFLQFFENNVVDSS